MLLQVVFNFQRRNVGPVRAGLTVIKTDLKKFANSNLLTP